MLRRLLLTVLLVLAIPTIVRAQEPTATPDIYYNPPPLKTARLSIDGYYFKMPPGPCVFKVETALNAHADIYSGNKTCDAYIKKARVIQKQKEAEDPNYVPEMQKLKAMEGAQ
jgi:hypothetical protein